MSFFSTEPQLLCDTFKMTNKYLFLVCFALSGCLLSSSQVCEDIPESDRIDCAPDKPRDKDVCAQRGCCYAATNSSQFGPPFCFIPSNYTGYKVLAIKRESTRIVVALDRKVASGFPNEVTAVLLEITFLTDHSMRLRFIDKDVRRYEVPFPILNLPDVPLSLNPLYTVNVDYNGILSVQRISNNNTIFSTDLSKLIYSDQFLQLTSALSSSNVYGIGEHKSPFRKSTDWQLFTLFNHDKPPEEGWPLYGSHPFHLNVEDEQGNSNGVLLFNSNAMDVILQPQPAITWRPIGGILDFFVFVGPKPDQVIREYITLIGKPALPPFWSLGYHQCRCCPSPHTLDEQKKIWQRTIDAKIPFDVQWNAKEYMIDFNDFTVDNSTFAGFGDWVRHLHDIGMHYVPIIDPGIDPTQPTGTYPPYDDGVALDVFIKNSSDQTFVGKVWNKSGKTVWPDFSDPNAILYWNIQFHRFHQMVPIDGAWNDMNEIANFIDGSIYGCPNNSLENPPYLPGNRSLSLKTLCMSSKQYAGVHYNVHNLYGLYMAEATNIALRDVRNKRPFIISRATFVGQGKYSGHWDGDTYTTFDSMKWTIPSIMNFNMFGIPLVGGDICGFGLNSIKNDSHFQELCGRWYEIGAFYPFARNHNEKPVDQDPVALGQTVVNAARNVLETRYSLLPYLYTLFYRAHRHADTVVRPLFFEFPDDINAYGTPSETQFMWGSGFMIIPVVEEGKTKVDGYFPKGYWYMYDSHGENRTIESEGCLFVSLDAPVGKLNAAIRGGTVVPILPPKTTTTAMRKENFTILVALDENESAFGELYWDSGDSLDTLESEEYSLVAFETMNKTLKTQPIHNKYDGNVVLENVVILGLKKSPASVVVNGKEFAFVYDSITRRLFVNQVNFNLVNSVNSVVWA